jgi:hypothetical protein
MTALRNEVRTSVQLLRDGLYGLQGNLHSLPLDRRPSTLLEPTQRHPYILELLHLASKQKAS